MKSDTQGFEMVVFKGAEVSMSENKIGLFYFEITFINLYKGIPSFGDLFDFVNHFGFELMAIYPMIYKEDKAGWTDVLFKHKDYSFCD